MKDLPYITHDIGARNDPKLMELQMEMGGQGLGIYWCLVEMLWENDGYLPDNYKSIAFALRWATPEEVEKVVTGFGLFEVHAGRLWSNSALARIESKREKFRTISDARSGAANARWSRRGNKPDANAVQMQCKDDANAVQNDATNLLTNKLTNKQKENNNNTPLTAADLFEIFFFMNFKDPEGEAARFLEYYSERGWAYQDGTPITEPEKAARDWKPAKAGKRFDSEALAWYRAVWNALKNRVANVEQMILSVTAIRRKGQELALVYRTAQIAQEVATLIMENDLAGDWKIDFRVAN